MIFTLAVVLFLTVIVMILLGIYLVSAILKAASTQVFFVCAMDIIFAHPR